MKNSHLYAAAQNLVAAETTYLHMKEYCDNLPADQEYDLGLRLSLRWGSSTTGYEEMQRALQQRLRRQMHKLMVDALENAKQNLFAAQRLLGKEAPRA